MLPRRPYTVPLPGREPLHLGGRTLVMGILNITPDSFADGGLHLDVDRAVEAGVRMVAQGADVLDIGGESTRPGAQPVGEAEERRRVLPVVEALATRVNVPLSIDTYKAGVAREAIARGATIVNDISGLQYEPLLGMVVAETGAALILMHTRGRSTDMHVFATYANAPQEVAHELGDAMVRAMDAGVAREAIILDPGFGFAKTAEQSYAVLAHLDTLAELDRPILSGPSRKSFLKAALGERLPKDREWGTTAAVAASVLLGAHIVRVHNVEAMVDVVRVADMVRGVRSQTR